MAWPKLTKNANFGPNLVVLGQKILISIGKIKSFVTHITENQPTPPYFDQLSERHQLLWSKIFSFGHFGPNIAIFCTFCPMPNQKPMWTRCLGGFSVMWVTKLLIFPVEIKIFCPKMTKFGPKLAFLVNLGQAMQAYSMPCCGSVGGCGARAVSRKTPIYFMLD